MADAPHQFYLPELYGMSSVRHRTINTPEVSTNGQTNVGYLPQRDGSFNHLLGLRDGISNGGSYNAGGLVTTGGLSGLAEGTSGLMPNIPSGRSGVQTTGLTEAANAQGQLSTPTQQVLPTTSLLVHPGTSPRRPGVTSIPVQNISSVRLGSPESSTMVLPNTQQQQSTPIPQVLPTTSSLVPPAASLGRLAFQGLPVEIVVPSSNAVQQTVPISSLPPLSSTTRPPRLSVVAPSPITPVLLTRELPVASSVVMAVAAMLAPGLQTLFGELQASSFAGAIFKDAPQTAYLAVQQLYTISTAVLSVVYWMSELSVMALQGMQQVAMLSQSTLFSVIERFHHRPVTNTCASALSTSLSLGCPTALQV